MPGGHARGVDAVLSGQRLLHCGGALLRQALVDGLRARARVGVARYLDLRVLVLLEVVGKLLHLRLLGIGDCARVYLEEHVAADRLHFGLRLRCRSRLLLLHLGLRLRLRRQDGSGGALHVLRLAEVYRYAGHHVEVPVGVARLLRVVLVRQHVGRAFQAEADVVAQAEVKPEAAAANGADLRALPVVAQVVALSRQVVGLVVAEAYVGARSQERREVEHAVGVVAAHGVRQVEHHVNGRRNVVVLVGLGRGHAVHAVAAPAALALPRAYGEACRQPRIEPVAGCHLDGGRQQVAELRLAERVLHAAVRAYEPVRVERYCVLRLLGRGRKAA